MPTRNISDGRKIIEVNIVSGLGDAVLVAGVAGKLLSIVGGEILTTSAATVQFKEQGGSTISGPFGTPGAGAFEFEAGREYATTTAGQGFSIARTGVATAITGELVYKEVTVAT